MIRSALAAVLPLLFAATALGQNTLEIIGLRHRTAEQVLPALRALLEPGGTLTGQGNQLILRASPDNVAELKRALEAIDRPLRRLQISVRFDEALAAASQEVEARGRISNRGARVEVRAQDYRSNASERVDQRIQVLEGGRGFIYTGESSPVLPGPGSQEAVTGFDAMPRVAGDNVILEIAPRRQTTSQQQYVSTTVSARLGEWFEVGAAVQTLSTSRIWLKVEELGP
jgi:type II secretory pathway component GspD/PulD (secretin)